MYDDDFVSEQELQMGSLRALLFVANRFALRQTGSMT